MISLQIDSLYWPIYSSLNSSFLTEYKKKTKKAIKVNCKSGNQCSWRAAPSKRLVYHPVDPLLQTRLTSLRRIMTANHLISSLVFFSFLFTRRGNSSDRDLCFVSEVVRLYNRSPSSCSQLSLPDTASGH